MKVLITSVGTTTAVNLIKFMKEKTDFIVIGTDINSYGFTAGSLMCDKFYQVPYAIDKDYMLVIGRIISDEKVDTFIPINDVEIEIAARYKHLYLEKITCLIPNIDIINIVRDKYLCNKVAVDLSLSVAEHCIPEEKTKKICRDKTGVGSKGIRIFGLDEIVSPYDPDTQIIQRLIQGKEYTVDCLCDQCGNPIYIIPRQRIEVKSGVATKVKIVRNEKLILDSFKLLSYLKIPGFSNIQFIEDDKDRRWFIEVNPRFSGCGSATALACDRYLPTFFEIVENTHVNGSGRLQDVNLGPIKWNSIVTRYYEELIWSPD